MLPIKLTRQDFQRLRRELIALGILITLAAAFYFGSNFLQNNLKQKLLHAQTAEREARNQLGLVQQELADLKQYLPRYQALLANHIVGNEQRLDWIETLESIQSSLRLPGLKYDFESRRALPLPPGVTLHRHKLLSSPMKLELFTLHEEQLLTTLETIQKKVVGLPLLRSCEMTPVATGNARTTTLCQYDWITLSADEQGSAEQIPQ